MTDYQPADPAALVPIAQNELEHCRVLLNSKPTKKTRAEVLRRLAGVIATCETVRLAIRWVRR